MKLLLIRHGHVEGLDPPRFRGRKELPLTPLGREQAELTARRIAAQWKIDAIYTSPLSRCDETGRAVARVADAPQEVLPGLVDFDYGEWAWKTHDEVQALWPICYRRWFSTPSLVRIPGGDSLQDLCTRVADALRAVRDRHPDGTIVCVGHDSTNRALLLQLLGLPLDAYWRVRQEPACVNEIDIGEQVRVCRINEQWHLFRQSPSNRSMP